MISKNSNIMTRKKCSTCINHNIKSDQEPCNNCLKLVTREEGNVVFRSYKENINN